MADETIDLIEESNDEIKNWSYCTNEPKPEEITDTNTITDDVSIDQQLIYIDSANLVANHNEQTFQYECDDNMINNEEQELQGNNDQMEEQLVDKVDNPSEHNVILKETIQENGELVKEYFCQQCNLLFNSIEDFLSYHPYTELLIENPDQQEKPQDVETIKSEDKLWDLVENLDETENDVENIEDVIEIKPNIIQPLHDTSQDNETSNNDAEFDKERYFCYDCQQVFTDLTTAENHDCINQGQNSNDSTKSKSTLLVDTADGNVYRCHLCEKDYTTLRSFNNHQRWHKKSENLLGYTKTLHDEPATCEICNTIFASEKNLKLHMKMHKKHAVKTIQEALPVGAQAEYNELNQFFCEICNKSFDQKLLGIHKNMHQNVEEYSCGKCNKQFENLPSYEIHMQIHVDNLTNVKKISTTQKHNEKSNSEEAPTTSSGGKRKHACQYCGKEFQRPYEKVKHERIHTGEKPYECEVCGKTFRVTYSLTLHLRTHTDIRPYVCATCNKRFKQQSVYVHHLKTHVVERGYKCEICGKSFRTSVQLGGHRNIHSKPYACTECNRPFASLYAVKIHMKTHSKSHKSNKGLKNRCSICGASYARVFALSFHIKEQHGIDVDPIKLLAASNANLNTHNDLDVENGLLVNVEDEASSQQQIIHFINGDDDDDDGEGHEEDDDVVHNDDEGIFSSQVDHEENIENPLPNNVYLDETEAATQTILNTEEISVDHFPTEEIITDWLCK